jgi:hypothetical protein
MEKPMTEQEINAFLDGIVQERIERELFVRDEKAAARRRRELRCRKNARLLRIISRGYMPHAGYVDWDFVDGKYTCIGKHIKYPKNSNCQRWMKRETSRKIRNCKYAPKKGNYYRRLFDYWWTLY